jgi:hypothetical protein
MIPLDDSPQARKPAGTDQIITNRGLSVGLSYSVCVSSACDLGVLEIN